MKKIAVILVVAFISVLILSSCDRKNCPAYSKAGTIKTGRAG